MLRFHPDKCYSIYIRSKSKQHCHYNYEMNNKHLENKFEIKDLGIIVDDNLRFSNHIIDKVNKANQIMGIIKMAMVYLNRHNFIYFIRVWYDNLLNMEMQCGVLSLKVIPY